MHRPNIKFCQSRVRLCSIKVAMKKNKLYCLFLRLFKIKKNGMFDFSFLKYLLSFWRYLCLCIMQIRKVMTSLIAPRKDKALNQGHLLKY